MLIPSVVKIGAERKAASSPTHCLSMKTGLIGRVDMKKFIVITLFLCVGSFFMGSASAIDRTICQDGSSVALHPSGSLKSCVLQNRFASKDVTCNAQSQISFYEDGQLESCVLADDATVGGQDCMGFQMIRFSPDGSLSSCVKRQ